MAARCPDQMNLSESFRPPRSSNLTIPFRRRGSLRWTGRGSTTSSGAASPGTRTVAVWAAFVGPSTSGESCCSGSRCCPRSPTFPRIRALSDDSSGSPTCHRRTQDILPQGRSFLTTNSPATSGSCSGPESWVASFRTRFERSFPKAENELKYLHRKNCRYCII